MTGRWMLVTAALWALPLAVAPPLFSRDVYAYACQGAAFAAGQDPHAAGPAALSCPWLDSAPLVWRDAPSPYGPLFTLLSGAAAEVGGGSVLVAVAAFRLIALVGVLLAVWSGRRLARACGVSEARAAWLGLAGPLVAVHAIAGAHNDALMAGLVLTAMGVGATRVGATRVGPTRVGATRVGATRVRAARAAVLAGLVLGLAVAVKVTALLALPFLVLVFAAHSPPRTRHLLKLSMIVVSATAAGYAALAAATGTGLGFVQGLARSGELAQWTSIPTAVGMSVGYGLRAANIAAGYDTAVAVARVVGLAVAAVIVATVWWRAWRTWRTTMHPIRSAIAGAGVAFAAVALLGPVFYPWYALTPLALLAVSTVEERVRGWLAAGCALLAFLVLPNGTGLAARTKLPGALAVTAGVLAVFLRRILRATGDRVRRVPTRSSTTGS